jgi:PKD repeat protein
MEHWTLLSVKKVMFFCLLIITLFNVQGQNFVPGIPESFLIKTKNATIIPQKKLNVINIDSLLELDKKNQISNRYGIIQSMSVDIKKEGARTEITGKGAIWRYEVMSTTTYSLGIQFASFHLPEGAKVYIYNETHEQLFGAFTNFNNNPEKQLAIAEFNGQNAIIEYFEPQNPEFSGTLKIGAISQAYKDIRSILQTRIGINCPEGANWQDEKHAICHMTFHDNNGAYYCTGFLVNNVRQDGVPYFQTANHCINTSDDASTLITYFNYEESTCTSNDANPNFQTLSGAKLKATNGLTDFSLLLLNEFPPDSYSAYYAGWDISDRNPKNGTCIHHPDAAPKCIAIDSDPPFTYPFSILWIYDNNVALTSAPNTHWRVVFDQGDIEKGSSGAPLFDDNKKVIGQLHGGNNNASFFGKNSVSWNYSVASNQQLGVWLDPDKSGKQTLDGAYIRFKPKAAFTTLLNKVCVGATVKLINMSKFNPTKWDWTITPSGYEYINGTTSSSISPEVVFKNEGNYSVSLITTNSYDADTLTIKDYIVVNNNIQVSMSNIPMDSILCGKSAIKYPIKASGAIQYEFSVEKTDKINYSIKSDSLFLTLKPYNEKDGSFDSWVKVTGTFGLCKSSDSALLKIVFQPNDNIKNAVRLWPGRNGSYSNQCATVEENEPHPPLGDCYLDSSKCFGSGDVLKNTIWFTFTGPSSGKVTIDTHGFDNRVAVYDAVFYTNDLPYYGIFAANEGRSSTDRTSMIENLSVVPGKVYWLQMDGASGETGVCTIDLLTNSLDVLPNPSHGQFDVIISTDQVGSATLEIFSLVGKLILKRNLDVIEDSKRFSFDLSTFPQGLYILKANLNGSFMKAKLMIVK